jgi:RNA-directed DNA polymerase
VKSLLRRIHERTSSRWNSDEPESTIASINSLVRGWCVYFDQGAVVDTHKLVRKSTERRVRRWLVRRTGQRGTGIAQFPDEYLYRTLGLYNVRVRLSDLSRVKV